MWALFSLLQRIWNLLNWNFHTLWDILKQYLGTKWAAFILIVLCVWQLITNALGFATMLVQLLVEEIVIPALLNLVPPSTILSALAIANTFFPLEEFFALLLAYVTILCALFLYRFIKSLVPTWGST